MGPQHTPSGRPPAPSSVPKRHDIPPQPGKKPAAAAKPVAAKPVAAKTATATATKPAAKPPAKPAGKPAAKKAAVAPAAAAKTKKSTKPPAEVDPHKLEPKKAADRLAKIYKLERIVEKKRLSDETALRVRRATRAELEEAIAALQKEIADQRFGPGALFNPDGSGPAGTPQPDESAKTPAKDLTAPPAADVDDE